jgi:L-threonylcarbamoyladenylate synthase
MQKVYTWGTPEGEYAVRSALSAGLAVLGDSDTVMGLFAPCNEAGLNLLDTIKGRRNKPYLIVVSSVEQAQQCAIFPRDEGVLRLIACWPAALTLIFKAHPDVPQEIQSPDQTVALRMPDHEQLQKLAQEYGGLFSTSANKTGMPVPDSIEDVDPAIQAIVGCIIGNKKSASGQETVLPSTILDCTQDPVRVVRKGAYPIKVLEQSYGKPFK